MRYISKQPASWRYYFMLLLFGCALVAIFSRVVYLSIYNQSFLRGQGDARTLRVIDMPAHRGIISDRHGKPLAVSTPVISAWIDPTQSELTDAEIIQLAKVLDWQTQELIEKIKTHKTQNKSFLYLKRQMDPELASKLVALAIPGVYFQEEYRRFYPEAEATAHLLGITDIDDEGQEGLELAYDEWLRGEVGRKQVVKDRLGRVVAHLKTLKLPRAGRKLQLSIDRRIQYYAYQQLRDAIIQHQANSGSVVVLDAQSGEILAMVNYPSFNPNNRSQTKMSHVRNRAVTDTFEPGSLIKPFSVANALASRQYTPATPVDTTPGWMVLNGRTIHDIHNYGLLDLETVLVKSSNIGVSKITLSLPPEKLPRLLTEVGFGVPTASALPGEVAGKLDPSVVRSAIGTATLSFGYGMTVTTLQLAQAYSLFANHGKIKPVQVLHHAKSPEGKQVLPPQIADTILGILEKVVSPTGTASRAVLKDYRVAGKTGTSRIVGEGGYAKNRHNAFFAGIAPVNQPRLVVVALIHDPQGKEYYGGAIAAPLFAEVMQKSLQILKVRPDKLI